MFFFYDNSCRKESNPVDLNRTVRFLIHTACQSLDPRLLPNQAWVQRFPTAVGGVGFGKPNDENVACHYNHKSRTKKSNQIHRQYRYFTNVNDTNITIYIYKSLSPAHLLAILYHYQLGTVNLKCAWLHQPCDTPTPSELVTACDPDHSNFSPAMQVTCLARLEG